MQTPASLTFIYFNFQKACLYYRNYIFSVDLLGWIDGQIDDLQCYVLFNNILVISGQFMSENED